MPSGFFAHFHRLVNALLVRGGAAAANRWSRVRPPRILTSSAATNVSPGATTSRRWPIMTSPSPPIRACPGCITMRHPAVAEGLRARAGGLDRAIKFNPRFVEAYVDQAARATNSATYGAFNDSQQGDRTRLAARPRLEQPRPGARPEGRPCGCARRFRPRRQARPAPRRDVQPPWRGALQARRSCGAISDQMQALELKPDFAEAFSDRGAARQLKGDMDGALADYHEAIAPRPA